MGGMDTARRWDWVGLPVIATLARLLCPNTTEPRPPTPSRGGSRSRGGDRGRRPVTARNDPESPNGGTHQAAAAGTHGAAIDTA